MQNIDSRYIPDVLEKMLLNLTYIFLEVIMKQKFDQ